MNVVDSSGRVIPTAQAIQQGDRVPHYDEIELPAHAMGQRFSRGIQEERDRELALREFNGWVEHWPLIARGEGPGEMVATEDEGV